MTRVIRRSRVGRPRQRGEKKLTYHVRPPVCVPRCTEASTAPRDPLFMPATRPCQLRCVHQQRFWAAPPAPRQPLDMETDSSSTGWPTVSEADAGHRDLS